MSKYRNPNPLKRILQALTPTPPRWREIVKPSDPDLAACLAMEADARAAKVERVLQWLRMQL